ncbi:F-box domain-protein [Cladorrhinum sp. PSN259]|nr:F-box domain-protein [Cladorrhinum sp. PSN259]
MDTPNNAATRLAQGKVDDIIAELVKERETHTLQRKGPLTLLELPIDILQLIFKEIPHTNDLTSLALTNSVLYGIATPIIYSRFDIVWPDGRLSSIDIQSVDALTYGLDTLCDGSTFARTTSKSLQTKLTDNDYCKYTRKFSIGNGPSEWVNDYIITKDAGKMLGTLVAIAVKKMTNLETFIWDMPTGVLSKVFGALGSLADQPNNDCKLQTVSVRWHDITGLPNAPLPANQNATVPQGSRVTFVGLMIPENAKHPPPRPPVSYRDYLCEYPTFTALPPLQSLSVLDIDEIGYLDEMADLIERSVDILQELKVGIAAKAVGKDFAQAWDGHDLKQIDHTAHFPGASTIGDRRLGGVLGILVSKIYDIKQHRALAREKLSLTVDLPSSNSPPTPALTNPSSEAESKFSGSDASVSAEDSDGHDDTSAAEVFTKVENSTGKLKVLDGKLRLRVLALERVGLSLHVCTHGIDMTCLTHLTLLDCAGHENLWKMLRKQFKPTNMTSSPSTSTSPGTKPSAPKPLIEYHLSLKYIHTDATTLFLITFIKETLAPNTLEVLFLQDRKRTASPPPVPLAELFKGAIKRHVSSLRKLLMDSSAKPTIQGSVTIAADNTRWRHWTLTEEVMLYITSGRMRQLRELSIALQYKDWHKFLQRLPNVSELRSLHLHHMLDYVGGAFDPKEMANQVTDIVTLRPEIKLCYLGMGNKCYELLEVQDVIPAPASNAPTANGTSSSSQTPTVNGGFPLATGINNYDESEEEQVVDDEEADETSEEDGEAEDEDEDDDDEDISHVIGGNDTGPGTQNGETANGITGGPGGGIPSISPLWVPSSTTPAATAKKSKDDDDEDDEWVEPVIGGVRLKMREILFYEDKVAIFKARHGRL